MNSLGKSIYENFLFELNKPYENDDAYIDDTHLQIKGLQLLILFKKAPKLAIIGCFTYILLMETTNKINDEAVEFISVDEALFTLNTSNESVIDVSFYDVMNEYKHPSKITVMDVIKGLENYRNNDKTLNVAVDTLKVLLSILTNCQVNDFERVNPVVMDEMDQLYLFYCIKTFNPVSLVIFKQIMGFVCKYDSI